MVYDYTTPFKRGLIKIMLQQIIGTSYLLLKENGGNYEY